jgi:hypothetical protein
MQSSVRYSNVADSRVVCARFASAVSRDCGDAAQSKHSQHALPPSIQDHILHSPKPIVAGHHDLRCDVRGQRFYQLSQCLLVASAQPLQSAALPGGLLPLNQHGGLNEAHVGEARLRL